MPEVPALVAPLSIFAALASSVWLLRVKTSSMSYGISSIPKPDIHQVTRDYIRAVNRLSREYVRTVYEYANQE